MHTLTIDPALPFLIPDRPIRIALIGCGGTGSHIAQSLARLAYHVRERGGQPLDLVFVDGDTVEKKNVGRQLFSAADIGHNKANALAGRFNAVFGLRIASIPQMLAPGILPAPAGCYGVLVGAVDGAAGRRELRGELEDRWNLWLDCGNESFAGQVCVGSAATLEGLSGACALPGLCAALPAPSLVYPDLLRDQVDDTPLDCAVAMEQDAQSLMVNQAMAAVAGQYLYAIVVTRRLTTFTTTMDLASLSMRSTPSTATAISEATGVAMDVLTKTERRRS
jgi:PRTRC genetic system ThiF family protein